MRRFAFVSLGSLALFACSAAPTLPVHGSTSLLDQTAAKKQCDRAKKDHDRPFVVEWDATDLASFEAKAARDTIVVRYEGCELEVLDECSDAVAAGRLGTYGIPLFTSGTKQSFEVANEGDLYAKLPLGAAELSGRIRAGESLRLVYFVTGVATSSRDSLFAGELAAYPGCAGATHFVSSYTLGAFELGTLDAKSAEGAALSGATMVGGEVKSSRAALASGGNLESCTTQDQRGCRVPIRLALRAIRPGESPVDTPSATPQTAAGPTSTGVPGTAASRAEELVKHAEELLERRDGVACLASLDEALARDLRLRDRTEFRTHHALCTMLTGRCEEGRAAFRATLAASDTRRELTEFHLDRRAREVANDHCPSATALDPADFVLRADRELQAAARVHDGPLCRTLIASIAEKSRLLASGTTSTLDFDVRGRAEARAGNDYDIAAACVATSTGVCRDALAVLELQCRASDPTFESTCKKAVAASFAERTKGYSCK